MKKLLLLLVLFFLSSVTIMANGNEKDENKDTVDVDHLPTFPGGLSGLNTWLCSNVKYPVLAEEKGIQGSLVSKFTVERNGLVRNVKITSGADPLLEKHIVRLLTKMPRWTPGKFKGKPVRVSYEIPFTFKINNLSTYQAFVNIGTLTLKNAVVSEDLNDENLRILRQKRMVSGFDNYSNAVFYHSGSDVYNGRGLHFIKGNDPVISLKTSLNSMLILCKTLKGHQYGAKIDVKSRVAKIINDNNMNLTAFCYRPDNRQYAVARSDKQIVVLNAMNDTVIRKLQSSIVPQLMVYNNNGNLLALAAGKDIEIWNMDNGTIRKTLSLSGNVNDVAFTDNNRKMLIAVAGGSLAVYETVYFTEITKFNGLGIAKCCRPIDYGKYAAVLTSDRTATIVNLLNAKDIKTLKIGHGNTTHLGVGADIMGNPWIIFNSNIDQFYNAFGYYCIKGLTPYYTKMMEDELVSELNQWVKSKPKESMEEYMLRVNEESRTAKVQELAIQVATRMAEGVLDTPVITVGEYNNDTRQLALHLDKMTDIFVNVPPEEMASLAVNGMNVKLRNVKYMLMENDQFEVAYAEVYDPKTGKAYVYDKIQTDSLSFNRFYKMMAPLDIVMKTNMEEISLTSIKDEIVGLAKKEKVISDKTHISVVAQVSPDISADGKTILNYDINFAYEVDQKFSPRDDFKSGHYRTEESGAAMSMLAIMKKAFDTDFAKYMKQGKKVKFIITGTADATPVLKTISYDGIYGEYQGEPVYKGNVLNSLSLTKEGGITNNEQLAFARAIGVQQYLEKELPNFDNMKCDYDYHIDVSKDEGSQYRRISVLCRFVDAF